jgi:hypothetical protein
MSEWANLAYFLIELGELQIEEPHIDAAKDA